MGSFPPTTEKTSEPCSNHWQGSRKTGFMFLNLRNMSGGGWSNAGTIIGDAFSIAWRITDSQYWGVPQRRKRIAVLADFNGLLAPEILFERNSGGEPGPEVRSVPEGLSRDSEESGSEGEDREDAGDSGEGSGISSGSYTFRNHFDGRIVRERSLCIDTCRGGTDSPCSSESESDAVYGFPLGFRPENVKCYEETATTLCNGTRPGFTTGIVIVTGEKNDKQK